MPARSVVRSRAAHGMPQVRRKGDDAAPAGTALDRGRRRARLIAEDRPVTWFNVPERGRSGRRAARRQHQRGRRGRQGERGVMPRLAQYAVGQAVLWRRRCRLLGRACVGKAQHDAGDVRRGRATTGIGEPQMRDGERRLQQDGDHAGERREPSGRSTVSEPRERGQASHRVPFTTIRAAGPNQSAAVDES